MSYDEVKILGGFIAILLGVNGYFFKQLVSGTNDIKLQLAILITKHDNTEDLTRKNGISIASLNERIHVLEAKLFSLENKI